MYKYETHLHTYPVSACAKASVENHLAFYKRLGYDGVFITNHFLDGNININRSLPYEEQIAFYCADYEQGVEIGQKIGLNVFFGIECSYKGTDFLVYGLDKAWFLKYPEIMQMKKREQLKFFRENGALVVHAHPFREDFYIDHIRLFPDCIDGVEVINANRTDLENKMAAIYAREYGFLELAGTDNHLGDAQKKLAGVEFDVPIENETDFIRRVKNKENKLFEMHLE